MAGAVFLIACCAGFAGCTETKRSQEPFTSAVGRTWVLTGASERLKLPGDDMGATLTLADDGRVAGQVGSRRYFGTFQVEADAGLRFGSLGFTRLPQHSSSASGNDPVDAEASTMYLEVLASVLSYQLRDDALKLIISDRYELRFTIQPMD